MGISLDNFARRHPRLLHMAEDETLDSIIAHGLLSTTALLDLFEVEGDARRRIESARRPRMVTLQHPIHGRAAIRDNRPFQEGRMMGRLIGMTFPEWYEHLNRRLFFWVTENRLSRFMGAYRDKPHLVLVVDTKSLFDAHGERVNVSIMNSGATNFTPPERGVGTFLPLSDHPYEERRKAGREPVVEVTVDYAVPDIRSHLVEVQRRFGGGAARVIWRP